MCVVPVNEFVSVHILSLIVCIFVSVYIFVSVRLYLSLCNCMFFVYMFVSVYIFVSVSLPDEAITVIAKQPTLPACIV